MGAVLRSKRANALYLVLIVALGVAAHLAVPFADGPGTDTYYTYLEGQRLSAGQNPYARILSGNMSVNDKYPTYFPMFFIISAVSDRLGFHDYKPWVGLWHIIFLLFNAGTGALIYYAMYRMLGTWAGIFGAGVWFFNRWTLWTTRIVNPDYIPLFFLVLGLMLLAGADRPTGRRATWAYLSLSLSLAVKQIAILAVPLFIIWAWRAAGRSSGPDAEPAGLRARAMAAVYATAAIASVVLVISLPFILWNAEGFVKSIAFSLTRDASVHIAVPSISEALGLTGALARLPMLVLVVLSYVLFAQGQIGIYTGTLLGMMVFIDFSSVLFLQYFAFAVPFLPLAAAEVLQHRRRAEPAPAPAATASPADQGSSGTMKSIAR